MFAKLSSKFFKPKWQHKDAKVRLQGLTELDPNSAELLQLAQQDPDNSVRLAAIARLGNMATLMQLGQDTSTIGEQARKRALDIATTESQYDEQLVPYFAWLEQHPALLATIARDPKRHVELRRRAIPTITDQAVLYNIANEEKSRELQALAATLIHDLDQLKSLEKTHGKNNKQLRQLVKERSQVEDTRKQVLNAMETCCAEVEALGKTARWEQDKTQLLVLRQRWKQFSAIPEPLQQRFTAAESDFQQRFAAYSDQESQLRPMRVAFETLLTQARDWQAQLERQPEYVDVPALDAFLAKAPNQWQALPTLPADTQTHLNTYWQESLSTIRQVRSALENDFDALKLLSQTLQQAETLRDQPYGLQPAKITALQSTWTNAKRPHVLRSRVPELEQKFQATIQQLNARLAREVKQREELLAELNTQLATLETALEQEQYSQAIELHHTLQQQLKAATVLSQGDSQPIRQRLQNMYPIIRELQDWRSWGTHQAREHLIESAEHLQLTELDPQERAKRIKALRNEWRNLSAVEPNQPHKQWREFDRKVTAAYEPSKQHFAEQARQRQEHLTTRETICGELEQLASSTDWALVDWKAIQKHIAGLRQKWKDSGTVSHKDWQTINTRFNAAMDSLEAHLNAERTRNWAEREQLVAQAESLLTEADLAFATEEAKHLQTQWHITVPARQGEEQRLWKQFRAPIDSLFERLKTERQAERSELQQAIDTKIALCEQFEGLSKSAEEDWSQLTKQQKELSEAFHAIRNLPKSVHIKLENRWQAAEKALQLRQQQIAQLQQWRQLEQIAANQVLSTEDSPQATKQGELVCLDLEILLGLETPAAFQKQRMNYQIGRMSESMLSRKEQRQVEPQAQAFKLFKQWYRLPLSETAQQEQLPRIEAAIQALKTQQGLVEPATEPKVEPDSVPVVTESVPDEAEPVTVETAAIEQPIVAESSEVETHQEVAHEVPTAETATQVPETPDPVTITEAAPEEQPELSDAMSVAESQEAEGAITPLETPAPDPVPQG